MLNQYRYWLYSMEGIGKKTIDILTQNFGTPKEIYNASDHQLARFLTQKQMQVFRKARAEQEPGRMYEALIKNNIRFIPRESTLFPEKLREIPDAPYAIYVKGKLPEQHTPTIAIIGARLCSEYGRYMARVFGQELGSMGFQVISGMAMGIDGISERAALQAGGTSFSVLGCGVDICYPLENSDLYELCIQKGGLISEYPPGVAPRPQLFPPRNRIISGLADAVLVIEARAKSGTLITVDMALEQGREVYVLPGRVTDRLSDGCNSLLKQGALIATCAADIAENFYGSRCRIERDGSTDKEVGVPTITGDRQKDRGSKDESGQRTENLTEGHSADREEYEEIRYGGESFDASDPGMVSAAVLHVLDVTPKTVGDIETALARQNIHLPSSQLMCTMVDLELCGRIYREGGSYSLKY